MDNIWEDSPYYFLQLFSKSKLFQNKQLKKGGGADSLIHFCSKCVLKAYPRLGPSNGLDINNEPNKTKVPNITENIIF